ncbi:MAG TPA: ATP-binding cassette domain-containing protein [Thermoanaerobaculia bacterium]|nr:ATP-binding cassette domain-containing protein [Thermoanaerobaculia bacterium]
MNRVELRDVSVRYPSQRIPTLKEWVVRSRAARAAAVDALRDVTLSVEAGEAFGIIGSNGAGKSTLLRVIAGIIPPSRGEVVTRGALAPIIELGTGFDGELSGRENVFFNGSLLGRSRAFMKRCEAEIIEFSGLAPHIDAPLRTYSTGMVARLAFAIATTIDAEIVLLDEVLAVGDASFREKCSERIRGFHSNGATIVFVSHDLESVSDLCSRAAWVENGEIRAIGPTEDVIATYTASVAAV